MSKYIWKDGCFYCENGVDISYWVYSDAIHQSPKPLLLPRWYVCALNENIMVEITLRNPPEKCPKRKE